MLSLLLNVAVALATESVPPPIVNGQITLDFEQVGAIMAYSEGRGGMSFCSATLVDAKWVLTAAHCIEAVEEYAGYGYDIYFMLGHSLYAEGGVDYYDTVSTWAMHPDYGNNGVSLSSDIGVMELTTGITEVEPMPMSQEVPTELWLGEYLDYVGWGVTRDEAQDSGKKRTTSIPYNSADEIFVYAYDPDTNLCSGDSGGAALRLTADGYTLVGVNSFVFSVQGSNPCVGGASGATRVDVFFDWIREYVPEPPPPEPEITEDDVEEDDKMMCASAGMDAPAWWGIMTVIFGLSRRSRTRRNR